MKKLITVFVVALLGGFAATAQNVEDLRIYINPGHGSWGPNNRHMATIGHSPIVSANPDTTDFYESNTNLWKCLELFHRLKEYGFKHNAENALDLSQNLVMSRIENGPWPCDGVGNSSSDNGNDYNRTLSEIAAEVESNNFDMFISVHSNASEEGNTTNYLYYAYDGKANGGIQDDATCIAMSEANWNQRILDRHTQWSHYDNQVGAGSVKIGHQGLGVLNHTVPGFLVEGYFHTYQPARHRAMNPHVCQMEGIEYARGVADYYGVSKESVGQIYGIVRDLHEKFSHELYNPKAGTPDVYLPLNGVDVTLKQGETVVGTYKTDVNYNGAFVFRNVQPGDYTIEFSHADYKPAEPIAVTVKAAATAYPTAQLENVNYVPPTVVYVNYPDSTAGKSEYILESEYDMTATTSAIAELEGKTIRRSIVRDGYAYILAHDASKAPSVYVYDITNKAVVKTLGTTAAVGDIYTISDIALTADGYLVGINKANQTHGGADNMKAYKWEKDEAGLPDGEVAVWWESNFAGNWSDGIGGEACYYNGTLADGEFVYTGTTIASSGNTRIIYATISNGAYIGQMRNNQDGTYLTTADYLGETYSMTLSPLGDDRFVLNSDKAEVVEMQKNSVDVALPTAMGVMNSDVLAKASANESYFKYAGRSLMVAPSINAEGLVEGIKLFDITDGLANAVEVKTNCTITPTAYTFASAHGDLKLTLSTDDKLADADIQLYLNVDGNITKWVERVVTAAAPVTGGTANPFAYALTSEASENAVKVSYSLNAAATDVNIIVKDEEGAVVETIPQGALAAGEHTADINITDYEKGNYTWAVEVSGEEKAKVEQFISHSFFHPAGLTVDNSMESPSFGTLFVAEGYSPTSVNTKYVDDEANVSGLYIFDPQGKQVLSNAGKERFYGAGLTFDKTVGTVTSGTANRHGDVIRVAVASDGRIFAARGNDSGDYILYAESLEKLKETGELTSLLAGQTMTSTCVYNDAAGNFMLGPVWGLDVYGSGENTKLLAHTRTTNDLTAATSLNRMFEFSIGTGNTLTTPTPVAALDQKYTIAYGKVVTVKYDNEGGIWYCQYRGTNTETQPGLVYVDAAGNQQYFDYSVHNRRSGAMDVSPDGKYLAAMSGVGQITVYKISKAADGTVALKAAYILKDGGNNTYDLAWDAAGNLYGCNASTEYVRGYAIPRTEAAVTTAAAKYAFTALGGSGVENVDVENVELPVVYYNLQGVQVDGENLTPGIYIKVQGNKSTKILVK